MKKTGLIIAGIVVLLIIGAVSGYNGLVRADEQVDSNWSQIDNQLQRRADLIPNLVATVQGFANQEKEIFNNVADARSRLVSAQGVGNIAAANENLSSALARLLAIAENYPDLKSDANFRQLQDELAGTENRIAVARKDYNDSVQTYNTKIKTFPTSLWAGMLGFGPREYFQIEDSARAVPQVKF